MGNLFVPHELKTIEVDTENKSFRINGEEFGKGCTGFTITCIPEGFEIRVEIETTVHFATFNQNGEIGSDRKYETDVPYFIPAVLNSDKKSG